MNLDLAPITERRWVTHEDSGAKFEINPLSAEQHNKLREAARNKDGNVDVIEFHRRAAKLIIHDWQGVGASKGLGDNKERLESVECTDPAKERFGKRFAYAVMPWLIEQAMEFDQAVRETEADAKNG